MEIIKKFLKKEMKNFIFHGTNKKTIKISNEESDKTEEKEKYEIWLDSLEQKLKTSKYRQALMEIESIKKKFESIPEEHWKYKMIKLKAIFKIIQKKNKKISRINKERQL
jgi:hypothetical protein